jgi:hypothetical protein
MFYWPWAVHNAVDKVMEKNAPEEKRKRTGLMKLGMIGFTVAVLLSAATAQAAPGAEDGVLWGPAADGISIGIRIEPPGRTEWHPGEVMKVVEHFRAKKANIRVPTFGLVVFTKIHVLTPEGKELIWERLPRDEKRATTRTATSFAKFSGEGPYTMELRLSEGNEIWIDAKTNERTPASLRKPGTYKLWAACEVTVNANAPKNAFNGKVQSGEYTFTVTDLPAEKRPREMTDDQKQLIDAWLAGQDVSDKLRTSVNLAENEALAARLVDIVLENTKSSTGAYKFLTARVGTDHDGEAGIDGPYLQRLAAWIVDVNEGKVQGRAPMTLLGAMQYAVVYLRFHPEDQLLRERSIAILKQWARARGADSEQKPIRTLAWHALKQLDILTPGMSKQQAVDVLGPPDSDQADNLTWTVNNPKLENPILGRLSAAMKDGKVQRWEMTPKF